MQVLASPYPRPLSLRPVALVAVALSVVLGSILANLPFVVIAIAVLVALLALVADKSLGTLFLLATCLHATFSYLSLSVAGVIGGNVDSNISAFGLEAYKVYFFGIVAMLIAYGVSSEASISWQPVTLVPRKLDRLTFWLAVVAALPIAYVLNQIGIVQMILTGTFTRYFGEAQVGSSVALYHSLLRKAVAVLAIAVPVFILRWQESRSKYLLVAALIGLLLMAATGHRGYIAVAVLSFVITNAVEGRNRKAILIVVLLFAVAFFSVQAWFINIDTGSDSVLVNTLYVMRSASTEVNDLAWVLSEWNHRWFWGATWVAGVWPVPAAMSAFKDTYVLSSVTKDIAGIPRDAESGGLRISMFGEAYLNFGYLGVVGLGLVFGVLVRKTNSLIAWAKPQGPLVLFPFVFFYMVVLCQSYLSGTATLSDAILSCLMLAIVCGYSMERKQRVDEL